MRNTEKNKGLITALIALAVSLLAGLMLCACDGVQPEPQPQPKPQPSIYTLTYIAGENGRIVGNAEQTVIGGESGTEVTAIANYGYAFVKWSDGVTTASRTDKNVSGDIEATATFEKTETPPPVVYYNVSFGAGAGGSIIGETAQRVESGKNAQTVTAVPDDGYRFVKWSDGVTTAERTENNVMRDIAVTAEFEKTTPPVVYYNVSYSAGTGGSISGETTQRVESGKNAQAVTAVPDDGYRFVKWSDGVTTAERTETNVTRDIAVTAEFEKLIVYYNASYSAGTGGSIIGETAQRVEGGKNAESVTAIPNDGYEFVKWSDGITTAERIDRNVTKNISVTAEFRKVSRIIYSINGCGIIKGKTEQSLWEENKIGEAVIAIPNSGYVFSGWSDLKSECERVDTVDTDMINNRHRIEIVAYFEPIEKSFKFDYGIADSQKYPASITINRNKLENVEFPVPELSGYIFMGWYIDNNFTLKIANENGLYMLGKYGLNSETNTVYARWKKIEDDEGLIEKILLVFVDEIQATLYSDKIDKDISIDYKMSAIERKVCETVPKCMSNYLNMLFNGKVKFEIDSYYTSKSITTDSFYSARDSNWNIDYSVAARRIPEIYELLSDYHNILVGFNMNDYEYLLHSASGSASEKYGAICMDSFIGAYDLNEYLNEVILSGYNLFSGLNEGILHEYAHTIEYCVDDAYDLHRVIGIIFSRGESLKIGLGKYFLCEFEIEGQKVGIPWDYWSHKLGVNVSCVPQSVDGKMPGKVVLIKGDGIVEQSNYVYGKVAYGASLCIEAIPNEGYTFVRWSDGIMTARRTDINIISLLQVEAIFIKLDY